MEGRYTPGGSPTEVIKEILEKEKLLKNRETPNQSSLTPVTDNLTQKIVDKLAELFGATAYITRRNRRRKLFIRLGTTVSSMSVGLNPTINKLQQPYMEDAKVLEEAAKTLGDDTRFITDAIENNIKSLDKLEETIITTNEQITTIAQDIEKYKLLLQEITTPGPGLRDSLVNRFDGDDTAMSERRVLQQQKFGLDAFEYLTQTDVTAILDQLQEKQDKLTTIIQNTETTMQTVQRNINILNSLPSLKEQSDSIANHLTKTLSLVEMYEWIQLGSTIGGGIVLLFLFYKLLGMASSKHHQYGIDGKRLLRTLASAITAGLATYGLSSRLAPLLEQAIQQQTQKSH